MLLSLRLYAIVIEWEDTTHHETFGEIGRSVCAATSWLFDVSSHFIPSIQSNKAVIGYIIFCALGDSIDIAVMPVGS